VLTSDAVFYTDCSIVSETKHTDRQMDGLISPIVFLFYALCEKNVYRCAVSFGTFCYFMLLY